MATTRVLTLRNRFCGDNMSVQINGPVTEVSIPARGTGVEATGAFRVRQSPDMQRSYAFYLDGELVDSLYFADLCPATCLFSGHIQTVPLYTGFSLGVEDPFSPFELDHGETAQKFKLDYTATLCATTVWHPNCATTVRILEGAELGTLVGPTGEDLGDEFIGKAAEIKQVRFSANGAQPAGEVGDAVVEVSGRGISSSVTFKVRRTVPPVHHFSLRTDPDTVSHGSPSDIFVTAKNQADEEVVIPPDTPVDFFVSAGNEQLGDLAATVHGTPVKGDQIIGVRYDQARVGGVIYIADGENPIGVDPLQVPIGVQLQGRPEVSGLGTVTVGCRIVPPRYAQGDSRWGRLQYDSSLLRNEGGEVLDTGRISGLGCALSSLAMVLTAFGDSVTPGELNAWMTERSSLGGGFVGDAVNWLAPRMRNPGVIDLVKFEKKRLRKKGGLPDSSQTTSTETLTEYLMRCQLAIVQVFNRDTENQHWVVVSGKEGNRFRIIDPGGRDEKYLDEYGAIWSYAILSKKSS